VVSGHRCIAPPAGSRSHGTRAAGQSVVNGMCCIQVCTASAWLGRGTGEAEPCDLGCGTPHRLVHHNAGIGRELQVGAQVVALELQHLGLLALFSNLVPIGTDLLVKTLVALGKIIDSHVHFALSKFPTLSTTLYFTQTSVDCGPLTHPNFRPLQTRRLGEFGQTRRFGAAP
jgi:hypothetical protein